MKYSEGSVSAQCASIRKGWGVGNGGGVLLVQLNKSLVRLQEQQRQGCPFSIYGGQSRA